MVVIEYKKGFMDLDSAGKAFRDSEVLSQTEQLQSNIRKVTKTAETSIS